jgi:hypothetical protein
MIDGHVRERERDPALAIRSHLQHSKQDLGDEANSIRRRDPAAEVARSGHPASSSPEPASLARARRREGREPQATAGRV